MKNIRIPPFSRLLSSLLKSSQTGLLLGILGLGLAPVAKAQFTLIFLEQAGATKVTWSGAWTAWGPSPSGPFAASTLNISPNGIAMLGASEELFQSQQMTNTGATIPWNDYGADPASFNGDSWGFGISGNNETMWAYAPNGYVAGSHLSGSATFLNRTLAQLGFDASEIANGGTITVNSTVITWSAATAIPEPGAFALIAGVIVLAGAASRRRSHRASSPTSLSR